MLLPERKHLEDGIMKGLTPSKIEWTNFTWNVETGCLTGCPYCYARELVETRLKDMERYKNGFQPTFHPDILTAPIALKKPSKIFISSMGELWGEGVELPWVVLIMKVVREAKQHTFLNLTKWPANVVQYEYQSLRDDSLPQFPENLWLGISVDYRGVGNQRIEQFLELDHPNKFISFEPLLEDVTRDNRFSLQGIRWIIIGACTGKMASQPELEWVSNIMNEAFERKIPIFLKNNLAWPKSVARRIQDFPEGFP
jgi:protein gp37